ncbi:MAG TPA: hypothetical protein IAD07_03575 [Candidatus Fimivicinus intestinavium]|nr:hypothetical protein [Candidatus Fimivicinus intestinavium]
MKHWVLSSEPYHAEITVEMKRVVLSNGLLQRTVEKIGCRTVSFENLRKGCELAAEACPDFEVYAAGKCYCACDMAFESCRIAPCLERVPFQRSATMTSDAPYPPPGKAVELVYRMEKPALQVTVRYEIYDGMPVIMKRVSVANHGTETVVVDNICTEILKTGAFPDGLFVDSDFDSTTDFIGLDFNAYAKNYARCRHGVLEVAPAQRMNVTLGPGECVDSITAFELLFETDYYEHRLIEVKEMYRRIAPWCTDNVLFFHLISNSARAIRCAADQCAEVGLEMVIQSFGSGVNMESHSDRYLNRIRRAYDYGHARGLRMGAYTLAYVKNYRPVRGNEALNHDGSHICRCLATEWFEKYKNDILNFIDRTGADAVEIDGPYGMMACSGGKTHLHDDFTDSQYKQWKTSVLDWYREIKSRGVYINAPDWHFLNGTNRTGVGYEEIAFSERREEQLVTSRIYYYKGTFSKNPSQGWGFLPLNVYHGGGKDAMFCPTDRNAFAFDWAMAQITASGVWPTIRGKKVYDSDTGKQILKKWITIFKRYRQVLNGVTVHFLPPRIDTENPSRTTGIDAIMNQLPEGEVRGFVMFFNQTDTEQTQELLLPVYYTGLTGLETPPPPLKNTKNSDVAYPLYGEEIAPLVIRARDGSARTYITDTPVADREIPPLPQAEKTGYSIILSEQDENPAVYPIDSNGNISIQITLPALSYQWYVLRPTEGEA